MLAAVANLYARPRPGQLAIFDDLSLGHVDSLGTRQLKVDSNIP
jgi:hypothetical protein